MLDGVWEGSFGSGAYDDNRDNILGRGGINSCDSADVTVGVGVGTCVYDGGGGGGAGGGVINDVDGNGCINCGCGPVVGGDV